MTVKIEVYEELHFQNISVIFILCVGGISLFEWKQGNTSTKLILKDLSLRDLFFVGLLETHIKF